jgi:hypothetical protein
MNCDEASAGEDVAGKDACGKPAESRRSGRSGGMGV